MNDNINIRKIELEDYEYINKWWVEQGFDALHTDILPMDGLGGIIIEKDVPKARCIIKAWSMPAKLNIWKRIGTIIKPPPIPKKPAIKPVTTAETAITVMINIIWFWSKFSIMQLFD